VMAQESGMFWATASWSAACQLEISQNARRKNIPNSCLIKYCVKLIL
jgi:hypothetical protein